MIVRGYMPSLCDQQLRIMFLKRAKFDLVYYALVGQGFKDQGEHNENIYLRRLDQEAI